MNVKSWPTFKTSPHVFYLYIFPLAAGFWRGAMGWCKGAREHAIQTLNCGIIVHNQEYSEYRGKEPAF